MDFTMRKQYSSKLPVKEVVYNAVQELTGGDTTIIFTNGEVRDLISRQDPDFKTSNVNSELRAGCVNTPYRDRHFPDSINYDYYWQVSRGHYRLYDGVGVSDQNAIDVSDQNPLDRFDSCQFHREITRHCRELYVQENYFYAVFEAAKVYNNLVKSKMGGDDDGEKLMMKAWGSKNGLLKINSCTSKTDINFQEGIKFLSAGLMRAVRNPTAHESYLHWPINQQDATDILSLISFLLRQYDKAIGNLNEDANTHYNRGTAYIDKGELDLGIREYTRAIALNPENANAYYNRGTAYSYKGEYDMAISDYTKVIALKPKDAKAYDTRANVWFHQEHWSKAKADLTKAKDMGFDIIKSFQNKHESVEAFEAKTGIKLPEDIAALLRRG